MPQSCSRSIRRLRVNARRHRTARRDPEQDPPEPNLQPSQSLPAMSSRTLSNRLIKEYIENTVRTISSKRVSRPRPCRPLTPTDQLLSEVKDLPTTADMDPD
jgi:hypothetical protein